MTLHQLFAFDGRGKGLVQGIPLKQLASKTRTPILIPRSLFPAPRFTTPC